MSSSLLDRVVDIAEGAGDIVLGFYNDDVGIEYKEDESPLTEADLAANRYITDALTALTPDVPVLSEESKHAPWLERKQWSKFWLVDPVDGTKEFIKRNGEFTVNIALIDSGKATLSVIVAPALAKTWLANGEQAWLKVDGEIQQISVKQAEKPTIVGSRSHKSDGMAAFLEGIGEHNFVSAGSSLKFCLVAEGVAQYYPRLAPTMMWDTAAGQCIAESAGAKVLDEQGEPLSYHREALLNPFFIVSI
ncbi:3'(2'),5'-bisphosphate nucleotidase CysQ [Thaumasiovibrio subtropicus]|uniref:3'(2'),5'-bisphosphate nucleotidase CysQ n=1 Tax=Thaumasiovibrio subtropicus TaxID=1891207 RepID=UPI000B36036F|nr:3'(2'),5'-bisphosphate nucleotidase CysQ [Thaumasiovibrio subtropicus]